MKFMDSFSALVICFAASVSLVAQTYHPKSVTFSGYSTSNTSELLAASGLSANAQLTQEDMQAAAQRLSDTGLFNDVRFSFDGQDLHYDLKAASNGLPAHFVNFPWWDQHELQSQIEVRVPLFHGSLPPESGMQQKVIGALTALLAEKQVHATVGAEPQTDLATGKTTGINFRLTNPSVEIGAVTFEGASPEWQSSLAEIAKAASGQEFVQNESATTLTQAIQHIYRNKGYLDIAITNFSHGNPQMSGDTVSVPVTMSLSEGRQFRLGHFSLTGSVLTSEAEFQKIARLKPGDVVEEDKLRLTMQMLSGPYLKQGYLHARINATPAFNRQQQTVDYAISVVPGEVYHMGKLDVQNLDDQRKTLFLKTWKLNEGDPFDASYTTNFLKDHASALHPLDGYSATYKQIEHLDNHIVDLVVTFRKGGPLS
jgi:outer membrane protein assembly factor BamA